MATITLNYDARNKHASQMIQFLLSSGLVSTKKTGLEEALEDIKMGRITTIHTPKNWNQYAAV